jgi:hypothetical protein
MDMLDIEIAFDDIASSLHKAGKSVDEIREMLTDEVERVCQEIADGAF